MNWQGFDKDFFIAFVVGIPVLLALVPLSVLIGIKLEINILIIFIGFSGVVWLGLHILEKRVIHSMRAEEEPIFCYWGDRVDQSVFHIDESMVQLNLDSHGLEIGDAIGRTFVCMTECPDDRNDYYFHGKFELNCDGEIIIKAVKPCELPDKG